MKQNWHKTRKAFEGRFCAGGIDLSAVSDFLCVCYMFPRDDDREWVDVLLRTWCPEVMLYNEKNKYRDQYQAWVKTGWMEITEGSAIDYDFIRKAVVEDASHFDMRLIGVDGQFQGLDFINKLEVDLGHTENIPIVIKCTNHPRKIGPVMQELDRRILRKKINHGGNPVLRFMVDSVAVSTDADGNQKPNKAKSQGKIDGVLAMIFALDRLMRSKPQRKLIMPTLI